VSAVAPSLISEDLLSLAQAAQRMPPGRGGRPVSLGTVLRWVVDGAPGPDGRRVRLEGCRVGGRWLTSVQALGRFAERLTPRFDGELAPAPRTPGRRERETARAAARLEAARI
jgi:hypothetical protein